MVLRASTREGVSFGSFGPLDLWIEFRNQHTHQPPSMGTPGGANECSQPSFPLSRATSAQAQPHTALLCSHSRAYLHLTSFTHLEFGPVSAKALHCPAKIQSLKRCLLLCCSAKERVGLNLQNASAPPLSGVLRTHSSS
jgi:hypothetical protein